MILSCKLLILSSIEELGNCINSLLINSSNKTKSKQTKKIPVKP